MKHDIIKGIHDKFLAIGICDANDSTFYALSDLGRITSHKAKKRSATVGMFHGDSEVKYKSGDVVEVLFDTNDKVIEFIVNDDVGAGIPNLLFKSKTKYRISVWTNNKGTSVKLLGFNTIMRGSRENYESLKAYVDRKHEAEKANKAN